VLLIPVLDFVLELVVLEIVLELVTLELVLELATLELVLELVVLELVVDLVLELVTLELVLELVVLEIVLELVLEDVVEVEERVEDEVDATNTPDAVPVNMTSIKPPFDQKLSSVDALPAAWGANFSEIVMDAPAAIDEPSAGNPVAV
jgi:hypothetical protein